MRPYAVIAGIGLTIALGIFLTADRQPGIWILPPLVLTGMLLTVFALSDRRREVSAARAAADELGLTDTGALPLPPLTPVLASAQPANLLAGQLDDGAPVRVARAHVAGGDLAVAATEILDPGRVASDPHGVLNAEAEADDRVADWVRDHPLRLGLVAEGGTLVVATVLARGAEPPFAALLDAAREARAKLA